MSSHPAKEQARDERELVLVLPAQGRRPGVMIGVLVLAAVVARWSWNTYESATSLPVDLEPASERVLLLVDDPAVEARLDVSILDPASQHYEVQAQLNVPAGQDAHWLLLIAWPLDYRYDGDLFGEGVVDPVRESEARESYRRGEGLMLAPYLSEEVGYRSGVAYDRLDLEEPPADQAAVFWGTITGPTTIDDATRGPDIGLQGRTVADGQPAPLRLSLVGPAAATGAEEHVADLPWFGTVCCAPPGAPAAVLALDEFDGQTWYRPADLVVNVDVPLAPGEVIQRASPTPMSAELLSWTSGTGVAPAYNVVSRPRQANNRDKIFLVGVAAGLASGLAIVALEEFFRGPRAGRS